MFATMSEAHAEWHRNSGVPMGTPGCPQDACHPPDDFEIPTHQVITPYGTIDCFSLAEAKERARASAQALRKTVKIVPYVDSVPASEAKPEHDTPCVCGPYDRCKAQREADYRRSGDIRDLHRAYND